MSHATRPDSIPQIAPETAADLARLRASELEAHVISNSLTTAIDADERATKHALHRLDLAAPALRALEELGLDDRVTLRPGGLTWHQYGPRRPIEVDIEIDVESRAESGSLLSITTRFSACDEDARVRLLDAWALVGPIASNLADRAARSVKDYAERDSFDVHEGVEPRLRAA